MNQLELYKGADFGADKETWLFLQDLCQGPYSLTAIVGDTYILSGLTEDETDPKLVNAGYIVYQGELLPFKGGEKQTDCVIVEEVTDAYYRIDYKGDGEYDRIPTYKYRYACFSDRAPEKVEGEKDRKTFAFSELKSFRRLLDLQRAAIPVGGIMMWSGTLDAIPVGWLLCDGTNGMPDLRDRFVVGAGNAYKVAEKGGAQKVILSTDQMPIHTHKGSIAEAGNHAHAASTGSAGYHAHSGYTNSAGNHRHGFYGADHSRTHLGSWGETMSIQYKHTDYSGNHSHSLNIYGGGSHSHSVSVAESGNHTHDLTIANTGGGQAHENRPPYYALAYIMYKG